MRTCFGRIGSVWVMLFVMIHVFLYFAFISALAALGLSPRPPFRCSHPPSVKEHIKAAFWWSLYSFELLSTFTVVSVETGVTYLCVILETFHHYFLCLFSIPQQDSKSFKDLSSQCVFAFMTHCGLNDILSDVKFDKKMEFPAWISG